MRKLRADYTWVMLANIQLRTFWPLVCQINYKDEVKEDEMGCAYNTQASKKKIEY
jgi:hypothetical protein